LQERVTIAALIKFMRQIVERQSAAEDPYDLAVRQRAAAAVELARRLCSRFIGRLAQRKRYDALHPRDACRNYWHATRGDTSSSMV
jgi:hypothetical protein